MTKELPAAAAVFLTALCLYWFTLAPGLIGLVDTPKFQFVGAILGVPHPPGYPLYALLSYGFSHLPFRSLAYRINLMSAVFGALTVALVFLCGRRAGAGRLSSGIGAFGLACGPLFWSTAVVAEVYTLHTALLASILLSLLSWSQTRSPAAYFAAVGCVALSVGHHTTMLLLAPAFATYVLMVDARFALQPRRVVLTAGLLALGLVPYAFIAVRTLQGAPYIETPIDSFTDAVAAVSSRRWQSALFAFDIPTLLRERVPFVALTLAREFSWFGLVAVVGGVVSVLVRHRPLGALLVASGLINVLFVLVYDIHEISVFLLPTALTGWLCATVFVEEMGSVVRRRGMIAGILGAVLIGWTGWHFQRGYGESDRSNEYQEIRRFDALFHMLPAESAVVADDYLVNSMVRYKLLGERVGGGRDIRGPVAPRPSEVRRLYQAGFDVIAFARSALALRLEGFRFAEVTLFESEERHRAFVADGTEKSWDIDPERGVEFDQGRKGFGVAHIRSMQLYRLLSPGACEDLSAGEWVDVARFAREGKVVVHASGGASVTMSVGRDLPLRPRQTYVSDGNSLTLETHSIGEDERVESIPVNRPEVVLGLTLEGARPEASEITTLVLGGIPDFAVARRIGPDAGTARICSATLGYDGLFGDPVRSVERLDWRCNGHDELLGHGWRGRYPDPLRRVTGTVAELLLPIWRRDTLRVSVIAARPEWMSTDQLGVIQLEVNGHMLEPHEISRNWTTYEWTIPASSVRQGMNRVSLHVSPVGVGPADASRPQGIRVRDIGLALGG